MPTEGNYANRSTPPEAIEARGTTNVQGTMLCHLNINSIQNKFEELTETIKSLKAQIVLISETKIDSTYPKDQFSLPGYSLYRNDRKKGGGGILALISTVVPCRRLKPDRHYHCLEPIVLDVKIGKINMIIIGLYRPPRP